MLRSIFEKNEKYRYINGVYAIYDNKNSAIYDRVRNINYLFIFILYYLNFIFN